MEYLLSSSTHKVRLSATDKKELERRSLEINSNIPLEFPRKLRPTKEWSKYKAVEHKFFILYAAPVLLKKLLSTDLYNHLMLFTVACRLLSSNNFLNHIPTAKQYFKCFVEKSSNLFRLTFMSLNIHNLIHVCDDVQNMNCNLNQLSAFSFESYLGKMSSALRSPTHIISQYCRRLKEKNDFDEEMPSNIPNILILQENKSKVIKIKYNEMTLSPNNPNSTVLLEDRSVAEIVQIYKQGDNVRVVIKRYLSKRPIFNYPCDSSTLNMWEVRQLSPAAIDLPLNNIAQKFVKLEVKYWSAEETRIFVIPLLH